jgi:hypothetical protein
MPFDDDEHKFKRHIANLEAMWVTKDPVSTSKKRALFASSGRQQKRRCLIDDGCPALLCCLCNKLSSSGYVNGVFVELNELNACVCKKNTHF